MVQDDFGWLEGRWAGTIGGDTIEEHWGAAVAGQRTATFRWLKNGEPWLYEWILFGEFDGNWQIRLKHFNPDGTGWEEKGAWTEFSLERLEGLKAIFRQTDKPDGPRIVYQRVGNELWTWFEKDGAAPPIAERFEYRLS